MAEMLHLFTQAFTAGDLAAAGIQGEEARCVSALKQLATAEFSREILLRSKVGVRLYELVLDHPSRNIQHASAAVLAAMRLRLYQPAPAPALVKKKPPLPPKTKTESGQNKVEDRNVFDMFQRAFKASASCGGRRDEEERCVDGFRQLIDRELPDDLQLLTYMGLRLSKLAETHSSSAVRKVAAEVLDAVRRRFYHMKVPTAVRPQVKRIQKSKIRRIAKPLQYRSNLIESY